MPSYCSLSEAFDVPDWVDKDPEPCNYGSQSQSDFVDRASGLPSNLMSDEQSQYLLYKQLQNKFGMVGPPQQQQQYHHTQQSQNQEAFGFGDMFAANDIDRLIIILLAGIILLSLVDYGLAR